VKALYFAHITNMVDDALVADKDFSIENFQVAISSSNPARLDMQGKIKITSPARQVGTVQEVDFYYSS